MEPPKPGIELDAVLFDRFSALLLAIIDGRVRVVDGCRLADGERFEDPGLEDNPDALFLAGVASEFDAFPPPHAQPLWNQEALELLLEEERKAEDFYREGVIRACQRLLVSIQRVKEDPH